MHSDDSRGAFWIIIGLPTRRLMRRGELILILGGDHLTRFLYPWTIFEGMAKRGLIFLKKLVPRALILASRHLVELDFFLKG